MIKSRTLVLLILLLLLVSSCSSGSTATGTPAPTTTSSPIDTSAPTATATPQQTDSPVESPLSTLPSIADVVANVLPSVVYVSVEYLYTSFFSRTVATKTGSGVIMSPDGYILTNNHVIEDARNVEVVLPGDEQIYSAEIIGTDPLSDLAVIKIEGEGFPTARFGDPSSLRVGDWVIALGNALGLEGGPTVTIGIVSNLKRSFPIGEIGESAFYDVIQTDADINRGNSGGPLVDLNGDVVGINTFVLTSEVETAGFAVNTSTVRRVYEELTEHGRVLRPYLGVSLRTVTPAVATELGLSRKTGVLVWYTVENSPAAKAGLKADDIIVLFEDQPVNEAYQITKILWQYEIGDSVRLTFWRGDDEQEAWVTLGERPQGP